MTEGACCPLWGKCRDSGKGGVVGDFELLPFNDPHPLSQAVRPASSPIGEPRGMVRIRLGFPEWVFCVPRTPPPRDARHLPFQGEAMEARKEEKWTVKYIM